jgi:hypothetical protein
MAENGVNLDGSGNHICDQPDGTQCNRNCGAKSADAAQMKCVGDKRRAAKCKGPGGVVLQLRHAERRCRQHELVPGGNDPGRDGDNHQTGSGKKNRRPGRNARHAIKIHSGNDLTPRVKSDFTPPNSASDEKRCDERRRMPQLRRHIDADYRG